MKLGENKNLNEVLSNENSTVEDICNSIENIIDNKIEMKGNDKMSNKLSNDEIRYINALAESLTMRQAMAPEDAHLPHQVRFDLMKGIDEKSEIVGMVERLAVKSAIIDLVENAQAPQQASWGALGSAITKEIEEAIRVKQVTLKKLSAYGEITNDLTKIDAGPLKELLVKTIAEAMAGKLEDTLINGDEAAFPGIMDGKEAQAIQALDKAALNPHIYQVQIDDNGRFIPKDLVLAVNPKDYFEKVEIAKEVVNVDGRPVDICPVKIIKVNAVPEGRAVLFSPKDIMLVMNQDVKIESSDQMRFLDDILVYKATMLANFHMKQDKAVVFDITGLQEARIHVKHD